ncbi:zinc ABC transporter substrate-binding protein [Marivirga harenae]|uniref:metal ABC transporter solute-binding protein, Zn/Mn family n=1 Tax=Marivirga harenae TaxID=2010992 RepID=UPI0026E104ED|nr:zinc ABC transporter substrate-binding protein [Marivirga harenae]WKV11701.1 zinc ABC transporter substrate-binding protein [Marivirga harenae]|tara:strand:+ start:203076 stop:204023 length:948 start_codon:yes stop_codon:yes gene_type:complete
MYWSLTKIVLFFFILSLSFSCTNTEKKGQQTYIVCTTGMIKDAVGNIVGNKAKVDALMGPGVDPHLYKATQGDLQKLQQADIIVYNGLFLEGKMGEILQKLKRKKTVIAMAELLPNETHLNNTEFQGAVDPHIWFDVSLWKQAIELLSFELIKTDSINQDLYRSNTEKFTYKLDSLHQAVEYQTNRIPDNKRVLVTAHDAFGYFGRAYNIEVRGLQGISTLSEFGLRDISNLVDYIATKDIPAIYTETSVSKKAIQAVLEGCRSQGHKVVIGGSLYSDAMGEVGTYEGTYIGMVDSNVEKIVSGLLIESKNIEND